MGMASSHIPAASGVYKITCIVNGRIYIGSAVNLQRRKREHFNPLRQNKHCNQHLQRAWNKYGEQAFTFEVLEYVLPMSLTAREQYWLNKLKPFRRKGFNLAHDTNSPAIGNKYSLGRKHTPEAIERMRRVQSTPEAIERKMQARLNKKYPPDTVEKIRQTSIGRNLGRKHTPEEIEKMKSRKHTPEEIERRRQATLARYSRTYILTSPDGTEYSTCDLNNFCKEHSGLDSQAFRAVARGVHGHSNHKGWKARYDTTNNHSL